MIQIYHHFLFVNIYEKSWINHSRTSDLLKITSALILWSQIKRLKDQLISYVLFQNMPHYQAKPQKIYFIRKCPNAERRI